MKINFILKKSTKSLNKDMSIKGQEKSFDLHLLTVIFHEYSQHVVLFNPTLVTIAVARSERTR